MYHPRASSQARAFGDPEPLDSPARARTSSARVAAPVAAGFKAGAARCPSTVDPAPRGPFLSSSSTRPATAAASGAESPDPQLFIAGVGPAKPRTRPARRTVPVRRRMPHAATWRSPGRAPHPRPRRRRNVNAPARFRPTRPGASRPLRAARGGWPSRTRRSRWPSASARARRIRETKRTKPRCATPRGERARRAGRRRSGVSRRCRRSARSPSSNGGATRRDRGLGRAGAGRASVASPSLERR